MTLIAIFWIATMRSRCHASTDILWSVFGGGSVLLLLPLLLVLKAKFVYIHENMDNQNHCMSIKEAIYSKCSQA